MGLSCFNICIISSIVFIIRSGGTCSVAVVSSHSCVVLYCNVSSTVTGGIIQVHEQTNMECISPKYLCIPSSCLYLLPSSISVSFILSNPPTHTQFDIVASFSFFHCISLPLPLSSWRAKVSAKTSHLISVFLIISNSFCLSHGHNFRLGNKCEKDNFCLL